MKNWKLIPAFVVLAATSSLVVQAASLEAEVQPEGTLLQSAQPASLEQSDLLKNEQSLSTKQEFLQEPVKEADIARQTSFNGMEALRVLCGYEEGAFKRLPTPDEIALANHFDNYMQVKALKELGASYAEIALQMTSFYGVKALKIMCGYKNGALKRVPTAEEIALANQLTSFYGVEALQVLCGYENGALKRVPTAEEIALANRFKEPASKEALRELGASYAEVALQITSFNGDGALKVLCGTEKGKLKRTPTTEEIALANQITYYGVDVLKILVGVDDGVLKRLPAAEEIALANQITSYYGVDVLKMLVGVDDGVLKRTPTTEEIALANEVHSFGRFNTLVERLKTQK